MQIDVDSEKAIKLCLDEINLTSRYISSYGQLSSSDVFSSYWSNQKKAEHMLYE